MYDNCMEISYHIAKKDESESDNFGFPVFSIARGTPPHKRDADAELPFYLRNKLFFILDP